MRRTAGGAARTAKYDLPSIARLNTLPDSVIQMLVFTYGRAFTFESGVQTIGSPNLSQAAINQLLQILIYNIRRAGKNAAQAIRESSEDIHFILFSDLMRRFKLALYEANGCRDSDKSLSTEIIGLLQVPENETAKAKKTREANLARVVKEASENQLELERVSPAWQKFWRALNQVLLLAKHPQQALDSGLSPLAQFKGVFPACCNDLISLPENVDGAANSLIVQGKLLQVINARFGGFLQSKQATHSARQEGELELETFNGNNGGAAAGFRQESMWLGIYYARLFHEELERVEARHQAVAEQQAGVLKASLDNRSPGKKFRQTAAAIVTFGAKCTTRARDMRTLARRSRKLTRSMATLDWVKIIKRLERIRKGVEKSAQHMNSRSDAKLQAGLPVIGLGCVRTLQALAKSSQATMLCKMVTGAITYATGKQSPREMLVQSQLFREVWVLPELAETMAIAERLAHVNSMAVDFNNQRPEDQVRCLVLIGICAEMLEADFATIGIQQDVFLHLGCAFMKAEWQGADSLDAIYPKLDAAAVLSAMRRLDQDDKARLLSWFTANYEQLNAQAVDLFCVDGGAMKAAATAS